MRKIIFRTSASADLRDIAIWTRKQWGPDQARRYVAAIRRRIKSLSRFPERFATSEEGYRGLRKTSSGRHAIFYLIKDDVIEIVRIRHTAMDFHEWT